jgi:DNA-binding SARP family transcriptional activator
MQASAVDPIDTRSLDFLSYVPPIRGRRLGMEEIRVSVEPETDEQLADALGREAHGFPLRLGKVQRPLLPDETLRRDRLLDWLDVRIDRRVIYVVAEAGFGKTTLVADFARRARIRTFWYRLDEDDTDSLVFLRYLVAACQAVDPALVSRSAALLTEAATGPAGPDLILETLLAEFECLGDLPSMIVLDDYHLVESVASIRSTVERLIARAPEHLTFVLVSRRTPNLAVAALRAREELAEMGREELRFDASETGRLFTESYRHPLDADVLADLQARTDGWAASLQLVKTAVDGRSTNQTRAFIRSLSGAEGDLYDYLAEEVVGDLSPDLRDFLMRAALLEEIELDTASVVAGVTPASAHRLIGEAERLGLLSKGEGTAASWRPHPLVREYLLARLESDLGEGGLTELHRHVATLLEPRSWRLAARHWALAGDADQVRRVVCSAVPTIIATGDLTAADELITRFPDTNPNPWYDIIRSRVCLDSGRYQEALEAARRAARISDELGDDAPGLSLASASTLLYLGMSLSDANIRATAIRVIERSGDPEQLSISEATQGLWESGKSGSLDRLRATLMHTLALNRERGHGRFEGITLLNLSLVDMAQGDAPHAAESGEAALRALEAAGTVLDVSASRINSATALAHLGRWSEALSLVEAVAAVANPIPEVTGEIAQLHAWYGDPGMAARILAQAGFAAPQDKGGPCVQHVAARLELACGRPDQAGLILSQIREPPCAPAFSASVISLGLQVRATACPADPMLGSDFEDAIAFAERQQAWFWAKAIRLTRALVSDAQTLAQHLASLEPGDRAYLSIQAELVARRLSDLDSAGLELIRQEAVSRPERWRWALRQLLTNGTAGPVDMRRAGELLELVGDQDDVALLRSLAKKKSLRCPDAGRGLIRRLAPRASIEDLGRLTIRAGDRVVLGSDVRKKVLSLLGFLLTRPQFTATREQVLDALWPDMDPDAGANSLNQTSYFLRRIFEPAYDDDTTAGYLQSRADLIWLDPELVTSRSADCLRLIAALRRDPRPELVSQLAETYTGRFAVDFLYDDWASSFRDNLHAGFLGRVERAVTDDTKMGAFDRAISVAQKALLADPDAEQIELCLLRLYRLTGAHAAAAEQYAHYATVMREQLGVEPPPLESL